MAPSYPWLVDMPHNIAPQEAPVAIKSRLLTLGRGLREVWFRVSFPAANKDSSQKEQKESMDLASRKNRIRVASIHDDIHIQCRITEVESMRSICVFERGPLVRHESIFEYSMHQQ